MNEFMGKFDSSSKLDCLHMILRIPVSPISLRSLLNAHTFTFNQQAVYPDHIHLLLLGH